MDCCPSIAASEPPAGAEELAIGPTNAPTPQDDTQHRCMQCSRVGRAVTRKTIFLMLKPEQFGRVGERSYRFCPNPDCRVVYFNERDGVAFTADDLRVRVGVKAAEDPVPLCYCFGFFEADVRAEIAERGTSSLPQRIRLLIQRGLCDCPARNPSGTCCLGEVRQAVNRILKETSL